MCSIVKKKVYATSYSYLDAIFKCKLQINLLSFQNISYILRVLLNAIWQLFGNLITALRFTEIFMVTGAPTKNLIEIGHLQSLFEVSIGPFY